MSNRSGGPGPPLFSVFCFSTRPPARHPEAARPPTHREIKTGRRPVDSSLESWGLSLNDSKVEREARKLFEVTPGKFQLCTLQEKGPDRNKCQV